MRHFTPVSVLAAAVCAVWMASASPAAAQTATGTVSGRVSDSSGLPMPGVLVTVESPGLQGVRTTTTSANGDYLFPLLPPSSYVITFELGGFGIVKEQHTLAAAQPLIANVTLKPATVSEVVTVQAPVEGFTKTVQASTSVKQDLLAALPTSRTLAAAVALAPAVHLTGPSNAISISGAMSFENVFMLNGVQVQDNLRGQPLDLFIEDAIQETTITTSGVSAEYGRFTGGVVNAITKSGGNSVSGSFRTSFSNDDWRTVSPFGEPKASAVIPTYEFTVGGPILRNRTWFFGAGRFFESSQARETGLTRLPYTFQSNQKRIEGKVTQSFGAGHTVRLAYTDIRDAQTNRAYPSAPEILDLNSLDTRTVPQDLLSLHYAGALRPDFFLEGQFSRRNFTFKNSGGKSTDLIDGTVVYDNETDFRYHAPTFCGVCAPEERDNESVLVKGRYFWSTPRGAHNIAFGYDTFNDRRLSDNHQSASDYFLYVTGTIVRDGVPYPIIANDESAQIGWWPILEASRGTKFRTHGLFVNDAWQYNRHLTFNLGLRWDKNQGKDAVGQLVASDSGLAPRLGVVWDPRGDGRWNVTASYGRYLAALANNIADSSSPAGTPALFAYFYLGPEINVDPGAPLVTTEQAVRNVFDWFQANGGTSRPTFLARVPGTATQVRESLDSPHADELAVGLSRQIGGRGAVRADVVWRKYGDFYTLRTDRSTGIVTNEIDEEFDLTLVENSNVDTREYAALNLQGTLRAGSRIDLGGTYTLSRLSGTINGENAASGPLGGTRLQYPEFKDPVWNAPDGDLASDQRHRLRVWANVRLPIAERFGSVGIGLLQQAQSGTAYGAAGSVRTASYVPDAGYLREPDTVAYFFTPRDAFRTAASYRTDLAFNYARRVPALARAELFAQVQVLNLFDRFQLFNGGAINASVRDATIDSRRYAAFDPFTQSPVEGTHWDKGPLFGQAVGAGAYTLPRTGTFSVGVRF